MNDCDISICTTPFDVEGMRMHCDLIGLKQIGMHRWVVYL